jgi:uncharacterized protein (TIGR00269 family)
MKCRKCQRRAAINMRQHKLALCQDHFIDWIREQTGRFITSYGMFTPDERILVAVSGGKDSLALWDILLVLGYRADGLYIGLGIDGGFAYSAESYRFVQEFVAQHPGTKLHDIDLAAEYGLAIPEASRLVRQGKPCSLCGLSKRYLMNRIALEGGYDVLATGHNLDDEAATLFGNTLHWAIPYMRRQGPVLPASGDGLVRKVKPLFRFYERETAAYAFLRGINYIYEECPFAAGATSLRHKEVLNQMENATPGTKLQFYLNFLQARDRHGVFLPDEAQPQMATCPGCGQPTTNDGTCAFCRTWERIHQKRIDQVKAADE